LGETSQKNGSPCELLQSRWKEASNCAVKAQKSDRSDDRQKGKNKAGSQDGDTIRVSRRGGTKQKRKGKREREKLKKESNARVSQNRDGKEEIYNTREISKGSPGRKLRLPMRSLARKQGETTITRLLFASKKKQKPISGGKKSAGGNFCL